MNDVNLSSFIKENRALVIISLSVIFVHLYTNIFASFEIFRDEFYYLACANRLAFGYVDQPPFSIYVLKITTLLFGDSLFAIRLLPAVSAGLVTLLTGLLTKNLGGKKYSILLASIIVSLAPIMLGFHTVYSMNFISIFLWLTSFYVIHKILTQSEPKLWYLLGLVLGIGLLNKIDFLWLCAGFFVGLLLPENRKFLKTKEPYIAALIAFLIFLPFIIWNFFNDFAHIEFMSNAVKYKYNTLNQISFIKDTMLLMNPFSLLVWIPGIFYFFINKELKNSRLLVIIFLTTAAILLINGKSKAEYFAAAFFPVIASGAIFWETIAKRKIGIILAWCITGLILISGFLMAPFALPILSAENYISYSETIGLKPASNENKRLSEMPQFYADMFGWEDLASNVAKVINDLPKEQKENIIIVARNYGEAGALEYYAKKYDLPKTISFHNNYWLWAHNEIDDKEYTFIVLGGSKTEHEEACNEVYLAGMHTTKYSMPYENNLPIFVCKKIKIPIKEIIKMEKHFI